MGSSLRAAACAAYLLLPLLLLDEELLEEDELPDERVADELLPDDLDGVLTRGVLLPVLRVGLVGRLTLAGGVLRVGVVGLLTLLGGGVVRVGAVCRGGCVTLVGAVRCVGAVWVRLGGCCLTGWVWVPVGRVVCLGGAASRGGVTAAGRVACGLRYCSVERGC